jgi:hypothetical protein
MKACRRVGSARPSNFFAFFHDSSRRCRAARIVSRQQTMPNRSCTQPTRRLSVQRGAGSAPATGGVAAVRWAMRTVSPSAASRRGQKGAVVRRCGGRRAPQARSCCRGGPIPSPSADDGACVMPLAWRSSPLRSQRAPESARGCADAARASPAAASPPPSGPTVRSQRATSQAKTTLSDQPTTRGKAVPEKPCLSNWTRFSSSFKIKNLR